MGFPGVEEARRLEEGAAADAPALSRPCLGRLGGACDLLLLGGELPVPASGREPASGDGRSGIGGSRLGGEIPLGPLGTPRASSSRASSNRLAATSRLRTCIGELNQSTKPSSDGCCSSDVSTPPLGNFTGTTLLPPRQPQHSTKNVYMFYQQYSPTQYPMMKLK